MQINGINDRFIEHTINNAKEQVEGKDFEQRLKAAMDKNDEKELKKVCREFEAILLSLMYKQMKATVPKSEFIPASPARDVFESMLDDSLMEEAAKGPGMGLGDTLYKQLSRRLKSQYQLMETAD